MYFYGLFNCAALKTEGNTRSDGSIAKPWRLCTVQQVEGLKTLIRKLKGIPDQMARINDANGGEGKWFG